jgi:nitrate/nitrite transporter NarK
MDLLGIDKKHLREFLASLRGFAGASFGNSTFSFFPQKAKGFVVGWLATGGILPSKF